jgi:ribosome biogenesis SPOUT family RNA methylase Rps3
MTTPTTLSKQYTYIVEHLDPELEAWSALEYKSIARESHASSARFLLSSVPEGFKLPPQLENVEGLSVTSGSVEDLYQGRKEEVCLLDPKAERELSPEDGRVFGCFLFGGILGMHCFRGLTVMWVLTLCR